MKMYMSYDDEVTWDEVQTIKEMLDIAYKNDNREFILKLQDSENEFVTLSSDDIYATYLKENKKEAE